MRRHIVGTKTETREVALVVAASNSLHVEKADYKCDGINDHVEIQAALNTLPATGGEVRLLDGTYNCAVPINLDTNQILRGCGRNTILTTSTPALVFLSAVGGSRTEKTGIAIADMQIDGGAGLVSDCGIYWEYVDYSLIQNVYSKRHVFGTGSYRTGIYLTNTDYNTFIGNVCQDNTNAISLNDGDYNTFIENICQSNGTGIELYSSEHNILRGNIYQNNAYGGIGVLNTSDYNNIIGNISQGNGDDGIVVDDSAYNTIAGNTFQGNSDYGISLWNNSCYNTVVGNTCIGNSQGDNNTSDDIYITNNSDYNNIQGNTCRAGGLVNKPRYGINISGANCDGNLVTNNDLYDDGFGTGSFNDVGTGTVTVAGNRT